MKVDRTKIKESLQRIGSRVVEQTSGPREIEDRIVPTIPVSRSDAPLVEVVNDEVLSLSFTGSLRLFTGGDESAPWVDDSTVPKVAEGWRVRVRTIGFQLFNDAGAQRVTEPDFELVYTPFGGSPSAVTEDTLWRQEITLADQERYSSLTESETWSLVTRDFFLRPGEGLQLVQEGNGSDVIGRLFYRYDVAESWLTIPR